MSVIVKYKGEYFILSKGADNVMEPLCQEPFDAASCDSIRAYSKLGLRTLVIASKTLTEAVVQDWAKQVDDAKALSEGREEVLKGLYAKVETGLILYGITAIEDKLQDGVQAAIETIKAAGIRFWVLTGDKVETAVEIVRSCQLFTETTKLAYMVNCKDEAQALELLQAAEVQLQDVEDGGLVLDGTFVTCVLASETCRKLLYKLATCSKSCICCRLSPAQKRKLVELVRENNKYSITLAIGDGANDVAMIQGAHVGVGIRGKEGNQSVQASDVAISQFRFLVPLLLCHGRRAYRRVATFLCYVLYKHITLAMSDAIWAHQSRFSATIAYPEWLGGAYPTLCTALPMIVVLCFDSDLPDQIAMKMPELYVEGLARLRFNVPIVLFWLFSSLYHGALCWLVPSLTNHSRYPKDYNFWCDSVCSWTLVVFFVDMRLWTISLNPFSKYTLGIIALSLIMMLGTQFVLGQSHLGDIMQPAMRGVPKTIWSTWEYLRTIVFTPVALLIDLMLWTAYSYWRPLPLESARRAFARGERQDQKGSTKATTK